jgi:hypothetical protein
MKPEFFDKLLKNTQISNFMKICPMGAEFLHVNGWRNITALIVPIHNFANTPKNAHHILVQSFLFLYPLLNTSTCNMCVYSQNYLTILLTSFYVLRHLRICQYMLFNCCSYTIRTVLSKIKTFINCQSIRC